MTYRVNIEFFRFFGMTATIALLLIGKFVTEHFVKWIRYPDIPFSPEATYIYQLFHFNHTCTVLDFNPSKTISAIVVMLAIIPLDIFVVLNYFRLEDDFKDGRITRGLLIFNRVITPIQLVCFTFFYMVFVNTPMDRTSFTLHYIPFMLWQTGLILSAIQQVHYLCQRDHVPFNIPKVWLKMYEWTVVLVGIYYTYFVWSFLLGHPALDTTHDSQLAITKAIMYIFLIISEIIPAIFAYVESKNPEVAIGIIEFTTLCSVGS